MSETLPTIVDKLIEGYKVDVLKTLSLVNSLVMPTPLGVPLTFNVSSLALLKVDGRVQLHNVRSWSELVRRRSLSDDIKLDVNIHPRFANSDWSMHSCKALTELKFKPVPRLRTMHFDINAHHVLRFPVIFIFLHHILVAVHNKSYSTQ